MCVCVWVCGCVVRVGCVCLCVSVTQDQNPHHLLQGAGGKRVLVWGGRVCREVSARAGVGKLAPPSSREGEPNNASPPTEAYPSNGTAKLEH